MDGARVYYTDQNLVPANAEMPGEQEFDAAENKFMHFVRECQVRDAYVYREQLKANAQRGQFFLRVEMEHLVAFDDPLVAQLRNQPQDFMKVFERAVQLIYLNDLYDETDPEMEVCPKF